MRDRRLAPEEEALWRKVTSDVRPLAAPRRPLPAAMTSGEPGTRASGAPQAFRPAPQTRRTAPAAASNTLDGGWDRRLGKGAVQPDLTIDLHGHTLASAHAALDAGLARAVAGHARIVLLVTGKPRPDTGSAPRRGVIRAGVPDWLAQSRFTDRIAAVRVAHPRHGGQGALYLILKRAGR